MAVSHVYDDVLDFLTAKASPEEIAGFRPSAEAQARFRELVERRKAEVTTSTENEELEEHLRLELFMIMAKARARSTPPASGETTTRSAIFFFVI